MTTEHVSSKFSKSSGQALISGNVDIIDKLISSIGALSEEDFTFHPEGSSSIAAHLRHVIEFYQEFLKFSQNTEDSAPLSYDKRVRNMDLETSHDAAMSALNDIKSNIQEYDLTDRPLTLSMTVDPDDPLCDMPSTLHRELFHVMDHAIHHMAIIKMTAEKCGISMGKGYGMANSTQAHNMQQG